MRRFFVPPGVIEGVEVSLPPELARRLATVLRLKRGDRVLLADGRGRDFEVEITALTPRSGAATVLLERPSPPEPRVDVVLYQSLVRPQRFDLVLEKGTELGVSRFVPLISDRAQVKTEGGSQRAERWRRIVTEAAEQCGRGRVPAVDPPLAFAEAVRTAPGLRLLPWEGERSLGLRTYLRGVKPKLTIVCVFVGPEGGFAAEEAALAREAGCVAISLGPRILRSETAGIVAAALVMHEMGELGD
ncbi:MAG: RsmE family RNA methyltransferase [Dehalococcoidia bacterium]|nr:RsmE family RNA methyltransferase [Dehalococcoidia bacterium]